MGYDMDKEVVAIISVHSGRLKPAAGYSSFSFSAFHFFICSLLADKLHVGNIH